MNELRQSQEYMMVTSITFPRPTRIQKARANQVICERKKQENICLFCEFQGKTKAGLISHIRAKHPENYNEYKKVGE